MVGLGGAALAWPLAASAQQAKPVIGFLSSRSQKDSASHLIAFRHGLAALGFIEGQNVAVEYRWADGKYEQLRPFAAELVARQSTVLVATGGNVSGVAARAVTDTTPIVFIVGEDPVKLGLVASLNSPAGNATGVSVFTTELAGKRLEFLHELAPRASTVGLLVNPKYPGSAPEVRSVREAAAVVGRSIVVVEASSENEIDAAFTTLAGQQVRALVVGADALFVSRRNQIVAQLRN